MRVLTPGGLLAFFTSSAAFLDVAALATAPATRSPSLLARSRSLELEALGRQPSASSADPDDDTQEELEKDLVTSLVDLVGLALQQPADSADDPDDDTREEIDPAEREAKRWRFPRGKKFKRKVRRGYKALPGENKRMAQEVHRYFLAGFAVHHLIAIFNAATLGVGLLVVILYMAFVYRDDHIGLFGEQSGDLECSGRSEQDQETEKAAKDELEDAKGLFGLLSQDRLARLDVVPDLVLVFDNPGATAKYKSASSWRPSWFPSWLPAIPTTLGLTQKLSQKPETITLEALRGVTFSHEHIAGSHAPLPKMNELLEGPSSAGTSTSTSSSLRRLATKSFVREDRVSTDDAIAAIIQDLYTWLPDLGFELTLFRSMDDQLLFLCISLGKDDGCITTHLTSQNLELPIQEKLEDELGVGECLDPSARFPPFIRYDPWIVQRLFDQGYIKTNDARNVYATHHIEVGGADTSHVVSRTTRVRMVASQLEKTINLDAAKMEKLLVDWYPTHSLNALIKLGRHWAALRNVKDLSFVQPVPSIYAYFGARVAFIFGWTGLYCKLLLPLVPVAFLWELHTLIMEHKFGIQEAERAIVGFTILILIWARIASNMWDREQRYFLKQFNLEGDSVHAAIRPEFSGVLRPSAADASLMELHTASRLGSAGRKVVSGLVTLWFILVVAFCIFLWFRIFNGRLGFAASICLSIQMKIFEIAFNKLSLVLNKFENHKYNTSYYDSLLWKRFLFSFVNSYCAFFYIATMQRFTRRGCRRGGCHHALRVQLTMTLMMVSMIRIAMVVVQSAYVRARLWYAERQAKAEHNGPLPKRTFMEEQYQYSEFKIVEQIDYMQALVIPLGYVILFGGMAPVTVPFSFAVFVVQLRASSFLLVTSTRQVMPRIALGIGAWRSVVIILMNVGVFFSGFLLAIYSLTFHGAKLAAKLSLVLVFTALIYACWGIVDLFVPAAGHSESILAIRRRLVQHAVMEATVEKEEDRQAREEITTRASTSEKGQLGARATWRQHRRATKTRLEQVLTTKSPDVALDSQITTVAAARWEEVPPIRENDHILD
jgi:hypothetical protein